MKGAIREIVWPVIAIALVIGGIFLIVGKVFLEYKYHYIEIERDQLKWDLSKERLHSKINTHINNLLKNEITISSNFNSSIRKKIKTLKESVEKIRELADEDELVALRHLDTYKICWDRNPTVLFSDQKECFSKLVKNIK